MSSKSLQKATALSTESLAPSPLSAPSGEVDIALTMEPAFSVAPDTERSSVPVDESTPAAEPVGIAAAATDTSAASRLDRETIARMIAEAAYYKAEKRGFEAGHETEDWQEAEREVFAQLGS